MNAAAAALPETVLPTTELAPEIASWPGTAEAAKMVGKHPSTIKLWRTQGRIHAVQDPSGAWRHNPDDLAENINAPDQTDPGTVLATGMTAIVQQGANANERLIAMTELATEGLKGASVVLSKELERAYARIAELEVKLAELREKNVSSHIEDLRHERHMRRLDQRHELTVIGSKETSARIEGLLAIVGPIAASIGARLLGKDAEADAIEARASGAPLSPSGAPSPPASPSASETAADMPFETRLTHTMSRLCEALRRLDGPALARLRAMMPPPVAAALDDVVSGKGDSVVGQALATIIKAAQGLSDLQFMTLRPIAPADVAAVLTELRDLLRDQKWNDSE